jgi:hypothetical protein
MHQRDHFMCLYLKTITSRVFIVPITDSVKIFKFCKLRSCTILVGPAENYWVQDLCPAYWFFFFKKSVCICSLKSLHLKLCLIPFYQITLTTSKLDPYSSYINFDVFKRSNTYPIISVWWTSCSLTSDFVMCSRNFITQLQKQQMTIIYIFTWIWISIFCVYRLHVHVFHTTFNNIYS